MKRTPRKSSIIVSVVVYWTYGRHHSKVVLERAQSATAKVSTQEI